MALKISGSGEEKYPVLQILDKKLPNIQEILSCDINSSSFDRCMSLYIEKYDLKTASGAILAAEVLMMKLIWDDPEMEIQGGFSVELIARAKKYVIQAQTKFGLVGLNEYYDRNDKLLGRVMFPGLGAFPCLE